MSSNVSALIGLPIAVFIAVFNFPASRLKPAKPAAERLAGIYAGVLPKTIDGGVTLHAPKVVGDVLVFEATIPAAKMWPMSAADVGRMMINGLCEGGDGLDRYFAEGGKLRTRIRFSGGEVHDGPVYASCPVA